MFPLNQTAGYAVLALGMMNDPGGQPVLVRDIAEATNIPKPYLSKLVHQLSVRGLVITRRGYRGGVTLARPAGEINIVEIVEAVGGRPMSYPCILGLEECSDERACPLHTFWCETIERVAKRLESTSLADAAAFECEQRALRDMMVSTAQPRTRRAPRRRRPAVKKSGDQ